MTDLELYISEHIKKLVPTFDVLEVRASIGDNSYSVEFFVTVDGKRMQCYDMVDAGLLKENEVDTIFGEIASDIRKRTEYKPGAMQKVAIVIGE